MKINKQHGDCYDNAAMENWNHSFKVKASHEKKFATRTIAKTMCLNSTWLVVVLPTDTPEFTLAEALHEQLNGE